MEKILNELNNLYKSFRRYNLVIIFCTLIIPILGVIIFSFNIVDSIEPEVFIFLCFIICIFSTPFILIYSISLWVLDEAWQKKANELIYKNLSHLVENVSNQTRIDLKHSDNTIKYSQNIDYGLLYLVNDILLLNNNHKDDALKYLSENYGRRTAITLENELIIEIQDLDINNITFECIETYLKEYYYNYYTQRKRYRVTIENFKGVIISTKLNNLNINLSNSDDIFDNMIMIYHKNLFNNPSSLTFPHKNKDFYNLISKRENTAISTFKSITRDSFELVNSRDLNYEISTIKNNIYMLYPKAKHTPILLKIANKIIEKLYTKNKLYYSFAIIINNTFYVFLNDRDYTFEKANLSYLFLNPNRLKEEIQKIKNQLEIIIDLIL